MRARKVARVVLSSRARRALAVGALILVATSLSAACGDGRPSPAGDGSRGGGTPGSDGCTAEGATRACHAEIGKREGFVDCFSGTQVCGGGAWSPCRGPGTVSRRSFVGAIAAVAVASLGPPSKVGAPCDQDPCNPYCSGYDEVPASPIGPPPPSSCAAPPPAPPSVPPYSGVTFPGNLTPAVQAQGLCDTAHGCTSCAMGGAERCQFDHRCDAASGNCVPNGFGYTTPGCSTVNLTLGLACSNGGNIAAPICNRGAAPAPAGSYSIAVYSAVGPSVPAPTSCPAPAPGPFRGTCTVAMPVIAPGTCVSADFSSCATDFSGETWLVVNAPAKTVNPECGEVNAPGCGDNWTYYKQPGSPCSVIPPPPPLPPPSPPVPPPQSYSETYSMPDCAPGTRGQWGTFAYDVATPGGSRVTFAVQTGPAAAGPWTPAIPGPPAGVPVADVPADHPNLCTMTGPTPCGSACGPTGTSACPASCACPIDLFTALSSPPPLTKLDAQAPFLQLNVLLESSAGSGVGPRLCTGGSRAGDFCTGAPDCPGGACTTYVGVCAGGASDRSPCNVAASCPGGTCTAGAGVCIGGSNNGSLCVATSQCPAGTCASGSCTGAISSGLKTTLNGTSFGCSGGRDAFSTSCNADPYFRCQQDFRCDTTLDACVWNVPTNYVDLNCRDGAGNPGVDLEIGAPCGTTVPLCNRGGGTVPAGTVIPFYNSMSGGPGPWDCVITPTAPGSSAGSYTLAAPLGPGACVNVYGIAFDTGQRMLYVNPTKSVTECGSGFAGAGGGCRNNSAAVKATGSGCTPKCGPGASSPSVPRLRSWQITYACAPAE